MAYTPHFLLQFGGTIGQTTQEVWSCGIRLHTAQAGPVNEQNYLDTVAAPALSDWIERPESHIGTPTRLTFAKFNAIDASGHYTFPDTYEHYYEGAGVLAGAGASNMPWQCCIAVTWTTKDVSRGLASRGRIYQPTPGSMPFQGGTDLFDPGVALEVAESAAELINTLDVGIGLNTMRPQIMSKVDGSFHQIDYVSVDNRIDIQRRRANAVRGARSEVEVLY